MRNFKTQILTSDLDNFHWFLKFVSENTNKLNFERVKKLFIRVMMWHKI
jgi:hypothetical protein